MVIIWFFTMILIYQFTMEIIFPFIIIYTRFPLTKTCDDEGVIPRYLKFRKKRTELIDRELLKNYLTFYEVIFTAVMMINNYPIAVLNVISLQLYLHIANRFIKNGTLRNFLLVFCPLMILLQVCITFYSWSRYMPILRYMMIEYQTTTGGVYFYMLFNFCTYAQDITIILI